MKTAADPRHQNRREAVRELFATSFTSQSMGQLARDVTEKFTELDTQIAEAAPAWPIDKLNKIDLAILRLAVFELNYTDIPPKVAIDEAVELAKEFGAESSPGFINGVLGTLLETHGLDKDEKQSTTTTG